jgi:hypothetical protein
MWPIIKGATNMDPAIIDISTKVLAVLLPFVTKGAEEFASKVGDAAYEKAKALLTVLRQKWSGDKEATESLALFEGKPERYKLVLEDILQEKLSEDKDLASELSHLLQEMGPTLDIIQTIDEGKEITGLKAKEMRGGSARVTQDIARGERITGAEFETLG